MNKIRELYFGWDSERREAFRAYLGYLRDLSDGRTNESAAEELGVDKKTVSRLITGESGKISLLRYGDALHLYFGKVVDEGVPVEDFETWFHKCWLAKSDDEEEDTDENQEDGKSTEISWQKRSPLVAALFGVALVGGGLAWYSGLDNPTEPLGSEAEIVAREEALPHRSEASDHTVKRELKLITRVRYRDEKLLLSNPELLGSSLRDEIFYQHNGGEFTSFPETSVWERQLSLEPPQELIFSIRDKDTGEEIAQFDRSDWLKNEVRKFLVDRARSLNLAKIFEDEMICDISGCLVLTAPTTLCSELIEDAVFVLGEERFPIRDQICEPHKRDRTRACISAQNISVPLKVENPPNLAVRFMGGHVEEVPVPLPVVSALSGEFLTSGTFRQARAYDLPTEPSEGIPGGFSVVATFQDGGAIQTHFRIIVGLDGCLSQQDRNNRVLYLNGKRRLEGTFISG